MIHFFYPSVFFRHFKNFFRGTVVLLILLCSHNFLYAQAGNALLFDGANSYVQLPDTIQGSYTKEAWIKINTIGAYNNIISGSSTAFLADNSGILSAGNGSPWSSVTDNTPLVANTWYHVAVTFDAPTQTMRLYKNGVLVSSASGLGSYVETTPETIGSYQNVVIFSGLIDEVSIWNYARPAADIAASMNCPLTGNEPGLTAYFNFNEGVADGSNSTITTLYDSSNRKCTPDNGTLIGFALTPGSTSNWVSSDAPVSGSCTPVNYAVIKVAGNATCINDGDSTPSAIDSTDFGLYPGSPVTVNYTITNAGAASLIIDSIHIGGADSAEFAITSAVTSPIAAGTSEVIQVRFTPNGFGNKAAILNIYSNDSAALDFNYAIQCNYPAPGASLNFDGINDYVQLPFILSGSYTKEAWVKTNDTTNFRNIISGTQEAFAINNHGQLTAGNGSPFATVVDTDPLLPNTWYHVAVTFNFATNEMDLYKNGVLVATGTDLSPFTDASLYIGAFQQLATWSGNIDEVRIWNFARTATQISNSISCTLSGDEPGLLAYYNFSNGTSGINNSGIAADSILPDLSHKCQTYNGQLENFALNGLASNWASDSPAVAGTCTGTYPNLSVWGNQTCIPNNEAAPSSGNATYFGIEAGPYGVAEYFVIHNNGTAVLNIDSVVITGQPDSDFIIRYPVPPSIAAGDSATLEVIFYSKVLGDRFATVAIYSSDSGKAPFTFEIQGAATVVLPVNFLSFNGIIDGATSKLSWKTSTDADSKGFEIQRSPDGVSNWKAIGFTPATSSANYNFTDVSPLSGINIYRLKQTDINGNSTYSNNVVLNFSTKGTGISLYPNPAKDIITVFFNNDALLNTPVQLSTITGRVISTTNLASGQQQIDLSKLPQGIYLLTFNNGEVKRLVKE